MEEVAPTLGLQGTGVLGPREILQGTWGRGGRGQGENPTKQAGEGGRDRSRVLEKRPLCSAVLSAALLLHPLLLGPRGQGPGGAVGGRSRRGLICSWCLCPPRGRDRPFWLWGARPWWALNSALDRPGIPETRPCRPGPWGSPCALHPCVSGLAHVCS